MDTSTNNAALKITGDRNKGTKVSNYTLKLLLLAPIVANVTNWRDFLLTTYLMRVRKITNKSTNHISHNSVSNPFFFITTLINYCNVNWKVQNIGILKYFNEFMM